MLCFYVMSLHGILTIRQFRLLQGSKPLALRFNNISRKPTPKNEEMLNSEMEGGGVGVKLP